MEVEILKATNPGNQAILDYEKEVYEESGEDTGDDFICDYVCVDQYLYYTVSAGIACITLKKREKSDGSESFEYQNIRLVKKISSGKFFSSMVADRRRKKIIIMNESNCAIVYDIMENGDLVEEKEIHLLPPSHKEPSKEGDRFSNSYSGTVVCENREILFTGVEYSEFDNREGEVYMIHKYATSASPKVTKLFSYKEDVKTIELLKTRKNWIVVGGGLLRGIPHESKEVPEFATFTIFDFSLVEVIVSRSAEGVHRKQIRDIKTFIKKRSQIKSEFEEEEEEMIVSCCNGGVVGIFNLEGMKIYSHDFTEILCSIFVVNDTQLIISGNWGGIHAIMNIQFPKEKEGTETPFKCELKRFLDRDHERSSTTHVGSCAWIGRTNFFFGTHGDCFLRLYRVKNVERFFYEDHYFFSSDFLDEDEKERMDFLISNENMEMCDIVSFRVDFKKSENFTESFLIPRFLNITFRDVRFEK